jgi:hypothetical protein
MPTSTAQTNITLNIVEEGIRRQLPSSSEILFPAEQQHPNVTISNIDGAF